MASANISNTTDKDFENDVLKSSTPVLVDLWATWCGPCKAIAPLLDALSGDYGDRLKIVKLDIDTNPQTPSNYGVTSIPTLLLFKGGELVDKMIGNPGRKSRIADFLDKHL
jgi:thioredoxin 1